AKLLAAIPKKSGINVRLDPEIVATVDAWIEVCLAEPNSKLESDLELAAAVGSKASGPSEVARYLLHTVDQPFRFSLDHWWKPEKDEAWYSDHRSDPAIRPLIERFTREVLPFTHRRYRGEFARDVKRLVPDLTSAFLDAAHQIVDLGVTNSDDAIAAGALDDLTGFEAVVEKAFKALTPTEKEIAKQRVLHLAIINGEYSDEYAEHLIEGDDDGYTAREFLKSYVRRVRTTVGWQHLASHCHSDRLRSYWLRELLDEATDKKHDVDNGEPEPAKPALDSDEIDGVFTCAYDTEDEGNLWYLLNVVWEDRYSWSLYDRIRTGHPSSEIRLAALACLIEHQSAKLQDLWDELQSARAISRLVEIALDLAHLRHEKSGDWKDHGPAASVAMALLPQPFQEAGLAYLEILNHKLPTVSEPTRHMLEGLEVKTEDIRRLLLAIGTAGRPGWLDDLHWLLANAEEPDVAVEPLHAAERAGLADLLDGSLKHKFADVRAEAKKPWP